ncbi:MAG: ABC transporter permease subunit, partial [Xanthomonadales bacterium]|nr:ABC transporter permease subunit [Xanthomonadales bacterium]
EQTYVTDFSEGVENRRIVPAVSRPYGERLANLPVGGPVRALAASENEQGLAAAALGEDGRVHLVWGSKQQNFLSGETELDVSLRERALAFDATGVALSGNHRWLYVSDADGRVHRFDLPSLEPVQVVEVSEQPITELRMLLGGISLLAGDRAGNIVQLFPVRDDDNNYHLERVRAFEPMQGAITKIIPEARRKGFVVLAADGQVGIYHATAGQQVWAGEAAPARAAALAPRANQLVLIGEDGRLHRLAIDNEHPEISFSALWQKVWYENYQEPEYTWQSSASSNDFEPKFSLSPLAFGTLKAALYAMLFAVPLALMGAAYTAYFMAPRMRRLVKPTIEIMEALPTVILGFLAGLWFAPWVESHLAGVFAVLLVVPLGTLLFAFGWHQADASQRLGVREGWEPAVLLPVLVLLTVVALGMAEPLQQWFFGGDLRTWLSQEAGISYDQRNAMVVGAAMGFAVIPTIFSIAEDAIFGVPKSLPNGSLALGATPWQSLVRVVLPTASPGIFSALMIGMGRAVGETMIVLMATGNTPVMDWNIFEGMRTLSANIAVEMPESEVGSS